MKAQSQPRHIVFLAAIYGSLFLMTLWAAYTNNLSLGLIRQIPYYDKIGHVVLYCIATYLGHRVLQQRHFSLSGFRLPIFPALFG
ncbi:MAG: hypothetical protein F6J97_19890, partial [Leptolyngbya sp. SIO4C1]|nr:hypothetical protein [Leptolyngbya sp. SIO4C1]